MCGLLPSNQAQASIPIASSSNCAMVSRRAVGMRALAVLAPQTCAVQSLRELIQPFFTVLRSLQELEALMQWLAEFGVSGRPFDRLRKQLRHYNMAVITHQPSLASTKANFASLRDELHMSDSQVRYMRMRMAYR